MNVGAGAVAALVLAAALALPGTAWAAGGADRIRQEKERLEQVRHKAEVTAAELAETISRERNSREKVAELQARLSRQKRLIARSDRRLALLGEEQDRMEAEARSLAGRKARKEQDISSMTVSLFLLARDRPGNLLGTGREERVRHFARRFAAVQLVEYGRVASDKEEVEEKLTGIERQREASAKRKVKEEGVGSVLASRTEAESRKLDDIARQKKRKERELRSLRGRIAAMEALVRKIEQKTREKAQRVGPPQKGEPLRFAGVPGGLVPPLGGKIVAHFGKHHDPVFDVVLENRGIEIEAPSGSSVKAVGKGEVAFNGSVSGFGKVLIIQHGSGLFSVYGKAESFSARPGQKVAAGESVGRLPEDPDGKSVLYLELRAAGSAIDPLSAIPFPK